MHIRQDSYDWGGGERAFQKATHAMDKGDSETSNNVAWVFGQMLRGKHDNVTAWFFTVVLG